MQNAATSEVDKRFKYAYAAIVFSACLFPWAQDLRAGGARRERFACVVAAVRPARGPRSPRSTSAASALNGDVQSAARGDAEH